MIFNILLLLAANIFIPYVPVPPQIFFSYCAYEYTTKEITIYDDMNLTRHYNDEDFKRSFRESLKKHHPDRGGNQQNFARIKAAKQIMQQPINYYDLYNITSVDLKHQQSIEMAAEMKELVYGFQTAIFYFIALLYFIAFTIDDKLRPSRKILLPLTLVFGFYDFYVHWFPDSYTLFDLFDGKVPLFLQSILLKRLFCIITAIIRTRSLRRKNQEDILIEEIGKMPVIQSYQGSIAQSSSEGTKQTTGDQNTCKALYIEKLKKLAENEAERVRKTVENEKSLGTKIKNWISKGFSFLIFGLMIWGFISSSMGSSDKEINININDNEF